VDSRRPGTKPAMLVYLIQHCVLFFADVVNLLCLAPPDPDAPVPATINNSAYEAAAFIRATSSCHGADATCPTFVPRFRWLGYELFWTHWPAYPLSLACLFGALDTSRRTRLRLQRLRRHPLLAAPILAMFFWPHQQRQLRRRHVSLPLAWYRHSPSPTPAPLPHRITARFRFRGNSLRRFHPPEALPHTQHHWHSPACQKVEMRVIDLMRRRKETRR
jgi:hypothetical protein